MRARRGSSFGHLAAQLAATACVFASALFACRGASDDAGTQCAGVASADTEIGLPVVRLDAAARERARIEVAPLAGTELEPELRAYGQVLDPAPLAELVFTLSGADAARSASSRELERARRLFRQDENTSARELEAAEAAFERDRGAAETLRARLTSGYGAGLARRADLAALVRNLLAGEVALARLDLPLGEGAGTEPVAARVAPLEGGNAPREAALLGSLPSMDPALPGRGFLCLVEAPLPAGMPLEGWLALAGPPRAGVVVPRAALLRHAGQVQVYVERREGEYERRPVQLASPEASGWFVSSGLAAGERAVVAGAQQLLSHELGAAGAAQGE